MKNKERKFTTEVITYANWHTLECKLLRNVDFLGTIGEKTRPLNTIGHMWIKSGIKLILQTRD